MTKELEKNRKKLKFNLTIDDPREAPENTLAAYAEKVFISFGVVIHFPDDKRSDKNTHQNAKFSFISGLAHGFGKPLLMLAEEPHKVPIDYKNMTKTHATPAQCVTFFKQWLESINIPEIVRDFTAGDIRGKIKLKASLGEYLAENEKDQLENYFVETAEYEEALKTENYMIFVGRKGTGKTANLYYMVSEVGNDLRNFICVIKPIDYQLEGILELFSSISSKAVRMYLSNTIWKYLIYTEIAFNIYEDIKSRPSHYMLSQSETELLEYIENNKLLIIDDFSVRLEKTINLLRQDNLTDLNIAEHQQKINERIHGTFLTYLLDYLSNVLSNKSKVYVLIDNLDKAWQKREDIEILAEFLFGLLGVSEDISKSFKRKNHRKNSANLAIIIYLRSDIFAHIARSARERDKLTHRWINWSDRVMLQKVIENRLIGSSEIKMTSDEIWKKFFVETIGEIPTRDYIVNQIIPRPRDIIYFSISALKRAINLDHVRIEESDIEHAKSDYSKHAFDSLVVEVDVEFDNIEEILIEFVGEEEIIDRNRLNEILQYAKVPQERVDDLINLLCDTTFLGRETKLNDFTFAYIVTFAM